MSLIFLSHAEKDEKVIRDMAAGLEEAGYSTWYYERDTLLGMSYLLQITRAIESCDAVVLLASPASISSDQVTKEVIGAFERGIPILPVLSGITPAELKEGQPEWRHVLGGSAMLAMASGDPSPTVSSITEGLRALSILPGKAEAPSAPVLSTQGMHAPAGAAARILAERSGLEGERKQVAVLCAEVTGLSAIDPEERHELTGPLMELMSGEVRLYEGTVASISPEGLTAIFGAPITNEDDPRRALFVALSIKERLEARLEALSLRAGVNTGLVIVGTIRDDLSMEYTAIGDTVSLASHLRDASSSGTILASEDTRDLAEGYFDFKEVEELPAGVGTARAYEVTGPRHAASRVEASLAKGLSHFVGREKELAHLSECLEKAREDRGQVVGIVGEAGVGKSRLVLEFLKSFPSDQYTLLQGGCYHYGEAIPYLPLLDVLKGYFGIEDRDNQASIREKMETAVRLADIEGKLEGTLPSLCELFSIPVEDEGYMALEPQQRRERLISAVRQLLATESARCPLVIVLEDLHWIDRTSEEFLYSLIDGITNSRMLLILLYRPEYISPWTSKSYYSTVRVDQLPQKTSSELISSILSEGEVSKEITELIANRASGNPLFIEELAHGLLENGSILKEENRYVLSGKVSEIEIPDTIQGIIAARLDRLTEDLKKLMQTASVIGREFAYRLLEAITQMQEELKSSLSYLQESELIYEKSLFPELEYIFKHALTQEVAYNSLLKKKRRELHGAIGQAIEALYPDRLEEHYEMLAYHYARSDDTDKAIHFLKLSGDKAVKNYSNWEAVRFYKESIQALEAQPEDEKNKRQRIETYLSILVPLWLLNFPEGSLEILEAAEKLSGELRDDRSLAQIYSKLSLYHSFQGDVLLAVEYSDKCFDEAEKVTAVDLMAEIASDTCLVRYNSGDLVRLVDTACRVLQLLEEQHMEKDLFMGGGNVFTYLSGWRGLSLGFLGRIEEAKVVIEKGLQNCIEMNDRALFGWLEYSNFHVSYLEGDGRRTIDKTSKAIEYFKETGINLLLGNAWSFQGAGHLFLGELEQARVCAEKGVRIQKESGMNSLLPGIFHILSLVALAQMDIEGALHIAEESLKLAQEYEHVPSQARARLGLGRVLAEADPMKIDAAKEYLRRGVSMADEMELKPLYAQGHLFLGEVFEIDGRKDDAIENLKIAEKMGKEMGMGYWLTRTQEALARLGAAPE
jgi:class 3 adenylate cyclase/tetratricopeptide (TPR) repeat protein